MLRTPQRSVPVASRRRAEPASPAECGPESDAGPADAKPAGYEPAGPYGPDGPRADGADGADGVGCPTEPGALAKRGACCFALFSD